MVARAVLAIAIVLLACTGGATTDVCEFCDESALIAPDEATVVEADVAGDLPIAARRAPPDTADRPPVSPALARVFRPPR